MRAGAAVSAVAAAKAGDAQRALRRQRRSGVPARAWAAALAAFPQGPAEPQHGSQNAAREQPAGRAEQWPGTFRLKFPAGFRHIAVAALHLLLEIPHR